MIKEKSCGCIIFNSKGEVLLVNEKGRNFWGFPKGHVEPGETEEETARREVKEEVNLDVEIDSSHRYETNYSFDNIEKTVIFFIAKPITTKVSKQDSEIDKYKWCSYNEALKLITYNDLKEIFIKAVKD